MPTLIRYRSRSMTGTPSPGQVADRQLGERERGDRADASDHDKAPIASAERKKDERDHHERHVSSVESSMPFRIESCSASETTTSPARPISAPGTAARTGPDVLDPADQGPVLLDVTRRKRRADDHHLQLAVRPTSSPLRLLAFALRSRSRSSSGRPALPALVERNEQRVRVELGLVNLGLDRRLAARDRSDRRTPAVVPRVVALRRSSNVTLGHDGSPAILSRRGPAPAARRITRLRRPSRSRAPVRALPIGEGQ